MMGQRFQDWLRTLRPNAMIVVLFILGVQFILKPIFEGIFHVTVTWEIIYSIAIFFLCGVGLIFALKSNRNVDGGTTTTICVFVVIGVSIAQSLSLVQVFNPYESEEYIPEMPIQITFDGTTARLQGDIGIDVFTAVEMHLVSGHQINEFHLNSEGGSVHAARGLARLVKDYGINTIVEKRCFSSCTLVFVASPNRRLGSNGRLGFHSYASIGNADAGQVTLTNLAQEQSKDIDYLISQGVSVEFARSVFTYDNNDLWIPKRQTLKDAGVISD